MKRFISEYANYKIKDIIGNSLMQVEIKENRTKSISHILRSFNSGLITIDEAARLISEA